MDLSTDSLGVGCLIGDNKSEQELFKIGECLLESSSRKSTCFFATRVKFDDTLNPLWLGAYCCTCALATPELKCKGIGQRFCMKSVRSFPFDESAYLDWTLSSSVFLLAFLTFVSPVQNMSRNRPVHVASYSAFPWSVAAKMHLNVRQKKTCGLLATVSLLHIPWRGTWFDLTKWTVKFWWAESTRKLWL